MIMPEADGMWLLDEVRQGNIDVGIIVATGYGSVELAVDAMKMGAWDFVQKTKIRVAPPITGTLRKIPCRSQRTLVW